MTISPAGIKRILSKKDLGEAKICPPLPGIQAEKTEPAAVLIPLIRDLETWKLIFIKRTIQEGDRHSGQIAFPGGRVEKDDPTLLAAALRETQEEIGVAPKDIEILGPSCPITTVTHYRISPYVGVLPWPYPLTLSSTEVQKTIFIPIDWLTDPAHWQIKTWQSPSLPRVDLPVVFFNEYEGEVLWGATAQIVLDILALIQLSPS